MFKPNELESIFIEIINPGRKNTIVGCIYKHPHMKAYEFINCYMNDLTEKLSRESNKNQVIMGDFNIDLLKYETNANSSDFLDMIYSNSLVPHITSPTRITPRSKTLIDNIFSTCLDDNIQTGNLLTTISDHLDQFIILPLSYSNKVTKKKTYQRSFDEKQFKLDLGAINWAEAL